MLEDTHQSFSKYSAKSLSCSERTRPKVTNQSTYCDGNLTLKYSVHTVPEFTHQFD